MACPYLSSRTLSVLAIACSSPQANHASGFGGLFDRCSGTISGGAAISGSLATEFVTRRGWGGGRRVTTIFVLVRRSVILPITEGNKKLLTLNSIFLLFWLRKLPEYYFY